jgi:3-hydroxyisobutyrate dehydrogenase
MGCFTASQQTATLPAQGRTTIDAVQGFSSSDMVDPRSAGLRPDGSITGFIGIGNMGLAMALRLRELGWPVRVRDLDAAREAEAARHGAQACATPAALAAGCARVVVVVVDAAQSEAVLFGADGAAATLAPGSAVLLCPTIAPDSTEAIAERLGAAGIDCIDAPMSGGPARARDGSMSLMVACADAVYERQRAVIAALSSKVFRVGPRAGDGARTKLVNNLLAAINLAGAAEALALAERVGLDPAQTLAVIQQSSGQSWIGSDRLPRALAHDLAPRAHATLLAKDSALAMAMATRAAFDASLGGAAAAAFARACESGWGAFDDAALLDFMRGVAAPRPAGR